MENIDAAMVQPVTPTPITPLSTRDLPGALALSASAGWNQSEADWRTMLQLGQGWGIRTQGEGGAEVLAASVVTMPYGAAVAWISMVLVLPEYQRRGYASHLLRHAIAALTSRGLTPILDATPAGHAVYLQEGFADTWGFARYRRERLEAARAESTPDTAGHAFATRALHDADWPAIEALDLPAFGASRIALLRCLAQRLPSAARVVEVQGRLCGYVLGRDGREATQIGPLVADDPMLAMSLLNDVLGGLTGPVVVDLLDHQKALLPWLQQRGFAFERPFTRMVHGALPAVAPGDPTHVVLAAGPELG